MWRFVREQNENEVLQRDAWLSLSAHRSAPPAIVWDYLVDPVKRAAWLGAHRNDIVGAAGGSIGPGSEYHCAHGDDNEILIFSVLDRRPLDYITFMIPIFEGTGMRYTDYIIASGTGTRIVSYAAPLFSIDTGEPLPDDVLAEMVEPVTGNYQPQLEVLAEMASQAAADLTPA